MVLQALRFFAIEKILLIPVIADIYGLWWFVIHLISFHSNQVHPPSAVTNCHTTLNKFKV